MRNLLTPPYWYATVYVLGRLDDLTGDAAGRELAS